MNITLIRATKRQNSSTYNAAKYFISKLSNVDSVFEFTLPDDMPHICRGCYACLKGNEDKCGGAAYLQPINEAMEKSDLFIFCSPLLCQEGTNNFFFTIEFSPYCTKWNTECFAYITNHSVFVLFNLFFNFPLTTYLWFCVNIFRF